MKSKNEKYIVERLQIPKSKWSYRIAFNGRNISLDQGVELSNGKFGNGHRNIWVNIALWNEFFKAVQRLDTKIRITRQDSGSGSVGENYSFAAAIGARNADAKKKEKAKGTGLDIEKIFGS